MSKQDSPLFVWDITIPQRTISVDDLKARFKNIAKKWAFQLEKGEGTGYMHYQCRISLKEKQREYPMKMMFNDIEGWVSRTSDANKDNQFYVLKNGTFVEGPWKDSDPYIPKQYRTAPAKWYGWQQKILDIIETEPDLRKIHIIVDPVGASGKSTITGYLSCRNKVATIPPLNDFKDVMRMVCDRETARAYFIDIPRALDKSKLKNFYAAIETIKNGYAFDERYHFKEKWFDTPHIFVFTNCDPEYSLLTTDRWVKITPDPDPDTVWKTLNERFMQTINK